MNLFDYRDKLIEYIHNINNWENTFPNFGSDETLIIDDDNFNKVSQEFLMLLKNNYPFHHPLYAGQMLKPPHPIAMLGYIATMMINPNNHALDGGPATAQMEKEIIELVASQIGFKEFLGHLTTSGTIANLEALFIAREIHPSKIIVFSDQAHYTHSRVTDLLKIEHIEIKSTPKGKMDMGNLVHIMENNNVGTVVVTMGTTSLGAIDELDKILELKKHYNFRIHIDGAYGGYFKFISKYNKQLEVFDLISHCDSFVFDPHKQGLQPYGCGCIIFNDTKVGRYYKHDSPYTYFTSEDLHLGEISLECSRAGAAAAALWLTTKFFELEYDRGMGPILKKTIDATIDFAEKIKLNSNYTLYLEPETNIVTYFPKANSVKEISILSKKIMHLGMNSIDPPLFLASLKISAENFLSNHPDIEINADEVLILRSCLMKPEHKEWIPKIIEGLDYTYYKAIKEL